MAGYLQKGHPSNPSAHTSTSTSAHRPPREREREKGAGTGRIWLFFERHGRTRSRMGAVAAWISDRFEAPRVGNRKGGGCWVLGVGCWVYKWLQSIT